jgi:hypothetical protein
LLVSRWEAPLRCSCCAQQQGLGCYAARFRCSIAAPKCLAMQTLGKAAREGAAVGSRVPQLTVPHFRGFVHPIKFRTAVRMSAIQSRALRLLCAGLCAWMVAGGFAIQDAAVRVIFPPGNRDRPITMAMADFGECLWGARHRSTSEADLPDAVQASPSTEDHLCKCFMHPCAVGRHSDGALKLHRGKLVYPSELARYNPAGKTMRCPTVPCDYGCDDLSVSMKKLNGAHLCTCALHP